MHGPGNSSVEEGFLCAEKGRECRHAYTTHMCTHMCRSCMQLRAHAHSNADAQTSCRFPGRHVCACTRMPAPIACRLSFALRSLGMPPSESSTVPSLFCRGQLQAQLLSICHSLQLPIFTADCHPMSYFKSARMCLVSSFMISLSIMVPLLFAVWSKAGAHILIRPCSTHSSGTVSRIHGICYHFQWVLNPSPDP